LEDRRNVGESSCNSGDGTDQKVQSLMFMMMMMLFLHAIKNPQNPVRLADCEQPYFFRENLLFAKGVKD